VRHDAADFLALVVLLAPVNEAGERQARVAVQLGKEIQVLVLLVRAERFDDGASGKPFVNEERQRGNVEGEALGLAGPVEERAGELLEGGFQIADLAPTRTRVVVVPQTALKSPLQGADIDREEDARDARLEFG